MARKKTTDPDQIVLIEVDHPQVKKFKEARAIYNSLHAKAAKNREKIEEARVAILAIIRDDLKIKPDVDGCMKFRLDGEIIKVQPGKSKLNFTTATDESESDDDGDDDGDGDGDDDAPE